MWYIVGVTGGGTSGCLRVSGTLLTIWAFTLSIYSITFKFKNYIFISPYN